MAAGAEFKITCKFETGATKVTWYRSGTKVKDDQNPAGKSELEYTIAAVAGADSGVYSCAAKYPDVASEYAGRQTKSLKVRGKSADATTHASVGTPSVTLTCNFYGDDMNAASWYKGGSGTALTESEGKIVVTAGAWDVKTNSLQTTLKISTIAADDAAAYTCKTTYKSGAVETKSVQTLAVLSIREFIEWLFYSFLHL